MKRKGVQERNNVVPFRRSAHYYVHRAMQAYEEGDLDSALRFFSQASAIEPDDTQNYYNIAITLGEMGRHVEAVGVWEGEVLRRDPELSEAYFHLAINYAELGEMKSVKKNLEKYLRLDPQGELSFPARQILNAIAVDTGGDSDTSWLPDNDKRTVSALEQRIRLLLNRGLYDDAVTLYEEIIEKVGEVPSLLSNLSSIYFMADNYEKAVEVAQKVVEVEPENIYAWCNLALYHHSIGNEVATQAVVRVLTDLNLISIAEISRWALTLGTLGRHRYVYNRLLEAYLDGEYNTEILHMLAVACVHLYKWKEARRYWEEILDFESHSVVAEFYLNTLEHPELLPHLASKSDYIYQLPVVSLVRDLLREQEAGDEKAEQTLEEWRRSPVVRFLANWLLDRDESELKLAGIRLLGWLGDTEAAAQLRGFIVSEYADDALKLQGLIELLRVDGCTPIRVVLSNGTIRMIPKGSLRGRFKQVSEVLAAKMGSDYTREEAAIAGMLWLTTGENVRGRTLRIVKPEVWAAGVEYAFCSLFGRSKSYSQLARNYAVSPHSVGRAAKRILGILLDDSAEN